MSPSHCPPEDYFVFRFDSVLNSEFQIWVAFSRHTRQRFIQFWSAHLLSDLTVVNHILWTDEFIRDSRVFSVPYAFKEPVKDFGLFAHEFSVSGGTNVGDL